jgi:hypothetical protein
MTTSRRDKIMAVSDELVKLLLQRRKGERTNEDINEESDSEREEGGQMKTAQTHLFQIPFKKEQIYCDVSGITHSVLKSLTILGLRKRSLCHEDSKRIDYMYDLDDAGISNDVIAEYLSTIFDTSVICKTNYDDKVPYLDLMNNHATLVSIGHKSNNELSRFLIMIYKHNGVIYCYDPSGETHTMNINKIYKSWNVKKVEDYECFYTDSKGHLLNKRKMVAPIRY